MAAEAETGGERTEEPSQKRLQDARERGQVPRSRELTNFATMIGGSATLIAVGGSLAARLSQMMRHGLSIDPQALRDPDAMTDLSGRGLHERAQRSCCRYSRALIGLVLLASLLLGGWNFSVQRHGAGLLPPESARRIAAAVRAAGRLGTRQGAAEMRGGGRRVRGHRVVDVPRRRSRWRTWSRARPSAAALGWWLVVRLAVRLAGAGGASSMCPCSCFSSTHRCA